MTETKFSFEYYYLMFAFAAKPACRSFENQEITELWAFKFHPSPWSSLLARARNVISQYFHLHQNGLFSKKFRFSALFAPKLSLSADNDSSQNLDSHALSGGHAGQRESLRDPTGNYQGLNLQRFGLKCAASRFGRTPRDSRGVVVALPGHFRFALLLFFFEFGVRSVADFL